ncbi:MAG: zf-HC2 domain-containing protein [Polyangiaceae bacterium]|nr:zf-HC2 domain-containing protein [Polyangiaceae bacterium]
MPSTIGCPDDLLARAQRSALSPEEQERLTLHVRTCPACRVSKRLSADFDQVSAVLPGDEQLMARVTRRLVPGPALSRPRAWWFAPVVATLLGVGVAAAAWTAQHARSHGAPAHDGGQGQVGTLAAPVGASGHPLPHRRQSVPQRGPAPLASEAAGREGDSGLRDAPERKPDQRAPSEMTSKSLFAEANRLRTAGRVAQAIRGYRLLQEQFPRSREAILSRVSLGNLLMGRHEAEPALEQFAAYLAATPGGVLGEEALFGKARALRALGRSAEEREACALLVAAYPRSVYEPFARARLGQLR